MCRDFHSSENVLPCIAIQTGAFNDAELADGVPQLSISLIGCDSPNSSTERSGSKMAPTRKMLPKSHGLWGLP